MREFLRAVVRERGKAIENMARDLKAAREEIEVHVAAEREACARIADAAARRAPRSPFADLLPASIANEIRARTTLQPRP